MDINKIENRVSGTNLNKTDAASEGKESAGSTKDSSAPDTPVDKVSISDYPFRNNDELFAKLELEKLNESSSGRVQEVKAALNEYMSASEVSSEAAGETELGQKINDPSVWGEIAHKILQ
ncbi:hypothetical protein SAMN05443144_11799 [Fodinibius roseus]|uniref:Uncharacterized protein n=1 Tax=Fodinibius roseus TaxID=1194090 RepID=A0A1M5GM87_9BACT|nr:hypothetical protein [Fodinibius roseus]SHG04817.1 hypothetical protein SAMN05443144_11799 [Fodinibius roseus]